MSRDKRTSENLKRSARKRAIRRLYERGLAFYGDLGWWPAESPFEVVVGAVLTQNTAWRNVEKALDNLKRDSALTPEAVFSMHYRRLEALIRPAGFFRAKRRSLREVSRFLLEEPFEKLEGLPTSRVREKLLALRGVGEETADSILLYAMERAVFVVDAYTERIFLRHGIVGENVSYAEVSGQVEEALSGGARDYNLFHAHLVETAKRFCSRRAWDCRGCPYNGVKGADDA